MTLRQTPSDCTHNAAVGRKMDGEGRRKGDRESRITLAQPRLGSKLILLKPYLPISGPSARMGNGDNLNVRCGVFAVNQSKRELSEQEPASRVGTFCPTLSRLSGLHQRTIYFGIEFQSSIGTAFQVPIECRVIFGGGRLVKPRMISGHGVTSPNSVSVLLSRK